MIDLKLLRDDPQVVRDSYARKGGVPGLDEVIDLARRHKETLSDVESLRAEQNRASKAIGKAAPDERQSAIAEAKKLSDRLKDLDPELETLSSELEHKAALLPNLVYEKVPDGTTEEENVVERFVGEKPSFDFEPKEHVELGESLGIFDGDRGAKTSGSRFVYLTGQGVILELALVRFVMDLLLERGFTPVVPPVLVREKAMYGTGFLPAEEHEYYQVERDDLYLVGTSEVAIASMHADEILRADQLPVRYAGFSSCFRREAGSYGKDTKGLVRVHQFDKVEQFSFADPETSWDEYEVIRKNQEDILKALEIPYQVLVMCAGDLGASAAMKVDHEAWLPGAQRFMEVTSATNATDYQARRLGARFRGSTEDGTRLVHTLNGTACAVGRTIVALLENHQRADGSVAIPKALQPHTGFTELTPR
jgi:seryl-tRNA synthetase